ncbi:MAG: ADP-ribosylglycohydrolase family protein, partial [Eubacteriales bacterium]
MKELTYTDYLNRIYGCFLGKCVGGTAGGPAEGRKELLDYPLDEAILHTALPNDDLDLQILWLEVMEEKGIFFDQTDLADSFIRNVPYGPGEYAYFMKNYARGILPPLSGKFNNRFYKNGMGCPIRSEIWACICPGEPEKTKDYVFMDGTMDHDTDSVWAEYFLASAEAAAFFCGDVADIPLLLSDALRNIPAETRIAAALSETMHLWREGHDWKFIRSAVIRHYGHPDCTNLYQNMCFTLLSLLFGKGDMRETIRLGCAMGYDTDCICATAASLVGIIRGADYLLHEDHFTDTGIKAAVHLRRPDCSIAELARDVAVVGMTLCDTLPGNVVITDKPDYTPVPTDRPVVPALSFRVDYEGDPVLSPGCTKTVLLTLQAKQAMTGILNVGTPDGIFC